MPTIQPADFITQHIASPVVSTTIFEGGESTVYLSKLADDSSVVLKVLTNELETTKEMLGYQWLGTNSINAPHLLAFEDNLILMTTVAGETIEDVPDLFNNREVLGGAAKELKKIHELSSKDTTFSEQIRKYQTQSVLDEFDILIEYAKSQFIGIDFTQGFAYLQSYRHLLSEEHSSYIHGDFCLQHIYADSKGFSGIIDFGDALVGDPLIDLAYFKFKEINKEYGKSITEMFFSNYFSPNKPTEVEQSKINLYMIYWGLKRVYGISDGNLKAKFAQKLALVLEEVSSLS